MHRCLCLHLIPRTLFILCPHFLSANLPSLSFCHPVLCSFRPLLTQSCSRTVLLICCVLSPSSFPFVTPSVSVPLFFRSSDSWRSSLSLLLSVYLSGFLPHFTSLLSQPFICSSCSCSPLLRFPFSKAALQLPRLWSDV